MALIYADRVQETTVTLGTGTLTLAGPVAGFQSFSVIGVGNTTYYVIFDTTTNEWEVGVGTVGPSTLARTTVFASTNANTLVNFAAGTKSVFASVPASVIATLLTTAVHNTVNHAGIPGVPAAETFTSLVHSATNHTGIIGVGDLTIAAHAATNHLGFPGVGNLATAPGVGVIDHTTLSHTGLPGVGDLTTAAHAILDHSSIPGAGLTTKQSLVLPASMNHQYWTPNVLSVGDYNRTFVPNAEISDSLDRAQFATMTIDEDVYNQATDVYVLAPGFGPSFQYSFLGVNNALRMESDSVIQGLLARTVWKLRVVTAHASFFVEVGHGSTGSNTFGSQANAIYARQAAGAAWTIERRIASVSQASTPTGVAATTAVYVLINYTSTTSVTVTFYDATTLAVLFTTTFSGAPNVPAPSGLTKVRLFAFGTSTAVFQLGSILLSFNE